MASSKKYWKSIGDLTNDPKVLELKNKEFVEDIPTINDIKDKNQDFSTSRRDFMKIMGFGTAAATLAACQGPVKKAIPYVVKPEDVTAGIANYYATTMYDGYDFASILVKTREGRPIKIESNKMAPIYSGTNARIQASVLSLYDDSRAKNPKLNGKDVSWEELDSFVMSSLTSSSKIALLTKTIISPSTEKLISDFKSKYSNVEAITIDSVSNSAIVEAYKKGYGKDGMPSYNFKSADLIISFGANFLDNWNGGGFNADYAIRKNPNAKMSRHIQIESNLSLTGSNADTRIPSTEKEQNDAIVGLYKILSGNSSDNALAKSLADEINTDKTGALIISGSDDKNVQSLVFAINDMISSKAFNPGRATLLRKGTNDAIVNFVSNIASYDAVVTLDANPVYTLSSVDGFKEAFANIKTKISISDREDETASLANAFVPMDNYLESWGDFTPIEGVYCLAQPTISKLFDTRGIQDSLLKWTGSDESYSEYLKKYWQSNVISGATWNKVLHDGFFEKKSEFTNSKISLGADVLSSVENTKSTGTELKLYTKVGMGDGSQANNPWLQEFPDPMTRASWDNYLTISAKQANELGIKNWNVSNGALNSSKVNIKVGNKTLKDLGVLIQPGQAYKTVCLALGYGRAKSGKLGKIGANAFELYNGLNTLQNVTVEKAEGEFEFACMQLQNTIMGREDGILRDTVLDIYKKKNKEDYNPDVVVETHKGKQKVSKVDIWKSFDRSTGHHFKLSIDLNACTGCGTCVIACNTENNVAVVGKEEVRKYRDMHWLRIDRYYSSDMTEEKAEEEGVNAIDKFHAMEVPSENPEVTFQPVMCQHCNHAPCESVCPVAATSHGKEGQNHMAYNRCIGTRYCANNCPYKVRRFNWFLYAENEQFDYNMNSELGRMVLNPDVVVRSRGVMEKCSMCIQMTQLAKLTAKKEGRKVRDDEFQTACTNACPSNAMTFGDINDKSSEIAELNNEDKNDRKYYLIEHIGVKPNVFYNVKVRNKKA